MNPILATSLLGGVLALDNRGSLKLMISQPLCGGLLTGIVLGAPAEGFFVGVVLQVMFLGQVSIRGQSRPDTPLGGIFAAALYILVNRDCGWNPTVSGLILFCSLFLAIVLSAMGQIVYRWWESRSWYFTDLAMRYVSEGKSSRASALHLSTLLFHFLYAFIVMLVVLPSGQIVVRFVVSRTSGDFSGSFNPLYVLVPFIGAGSLIRLNLVKSRVFWFVAGFLVSYVFLLVRG